MKQNFLTPRIIAEITNGQYIGENEAFDIRVIGAVRDNRDVEPGNLFVCIKGARVDGHSFANKAFESGATCCLAEQELIEPKGPYVLVTSTLEAIKTIGAYYRSLFNIPVIGITGSVGKTTAKELIASVLSVKYNTLRTPGNLNNELGVPLTLLSLNETHEAAVIEMGISDFGEMSRLAQMVRPDIFVMTRIGYAHLDMLKDLDGVLKAKTEAFKYMKPDGIAVLNGDDELLRTYDPGMKKILYGLREDNDICIENIKINIPAYGSHLKELLGAAVAVGTLLGLTKDEIKRGITGYEPVEGRANIINTGEITLIDDCYNANPNSVKAALTSLTTLPGRHVAILGDMLELGEQSEELHHEIGEYAKKTGIDCLICAGVEADNIYKGYLSTNSGEAYYFPTKEKLVSRLPELIKKDDAVLVKASNGMRFCEIVKLLTPNS